VGSSQNIGQPLTYLNAAVAEGCAKLSEKIEAGTSIRDAVAELYAENLHVIFNGNGYSDEWPVEAEKRGLLNLRDTPAALATFDAPKNKALFKSHGVFTEKEVEARKEIMLDEYSATLLMEAETALVMTYTGYLPACAADMKTYEGTGLGGNRPVAYQSVATEAQKLADTMENVPEDAQAKADYFAGVVKPQLESLRSAVDTAEQLCEASKWPVPTYNEMLFHHISADSFSTVPATE